MAKRFIALVFCFCTFFAVVAAQNAETSDLHFDSLEFPVGDIMDDQGPVSREFCFTNESRAPISLAEVYTTCNCLRAEYDAQPVLPGEKGKIELTFNPSNYTGDIKVKALVYVVGIKAPVSRIHLSGHVNISDQWWYLSQKMGRLRLKRKLVEMDEVGSSGRIEARVLSANTGRTPMTLKAVSLPDFASFRTEPAEILPGKEADLILEVDAGKLSAIHDRSENVEFEFLLDGTGAVNPFSTIIKVKILPSENNEKK